MDRTIARIISRLLEPAILLFLLILLAAHRIGIPALDFMRIIGIIVAAAFFPPFALLWNAVRTKKISNWDISDRRQRVKALSVFMILLVIDFFVFRALSQQIFLHLFLFFCIMVLILFFITLFWKVSGHLSTLTVFIGLILVWYGRRWWPLVALLPVLSWSRVKLQRHTLAQTIGGIVLGGCMMYIGRFLHLV